MSLLSLIIRFFLRVTSLFKQDCSHFIIILLPSSQAREMEGDRPLQEDLSTAFAQVTVVIRDVNDSPPEFNRKEYEVSIPESIGDGTLLPDLDMVVSDPDVVSMVFACLG